MDFTAADRCHLETALQLAEEAAIHREVPVGAVVVEAEEVIGRGANRQIAECDPTAHAEIVALREAARRRGNHRLPGATLYVTLEPCLMCYGAAVHARLARIVYGCPDPKGGAVSGGTHGSHKGLNHDLELIGGLEAERAGALLVEFFRTRRGTEVVVTGPTRNRIGG